MKILFVSDVSIQDDMSGAERVLFEQTTRLAARGHDVHILTRRLPSHQSDDDVIQNVREWRYRVNQDNAISFMGPTVKEQWLPIGVIHRVLRRDDLPCIGCNLGYRKIKTHDCMRRIKPERVINLIL